MFCLPKTAWPPTSHDKPQQHETPTHSPLIHAICARVVCVSPLWPCVGTMMCASSSAHHRSPPSLTPWKTQCASSVLFALPASVCSRVGPAPAREPHRSENVAGCSSMECQGIDRTWQCGVVLALEPAQGSYGARSAHHTGVCAFARACVWGVLPSPRPVGTQTPSLRPLPLSEREERRKRGRPQRGDRSRRQPAMMGPLRVEGIVAPEVKFLDRRKTSGGEGVLHVRVRRSRMRVRGTKMIRHRRSPAL